MDKQKYMDYIIEMAKNADEEYLRKVYLVMIGMNGGKVK